LAALNATSVGSTNLQRSKRRFGEDIVSSLSALAPFAAPFGASSHVATSAPASPCQTTADGAMGGCVEMDLCANVPMSLPSRPRKLGEAVLAMPWSLEERRALATNSTRERYRGMRK
jgi:hypothetical protein